MNTAVAAPKAAEAANTQIVTIEPEKYVAAVFQPFAKRVKAAIKAVEGLKYDITTTAGMDMAKEARALFRAIRIEANKERELRKAPIIAIGRLLDTRNSELAAQVAPYEDKFDADIKAEEKRKEDEKAARLKAEAERNAAIQERIDAIKNKPLEAITMTSAQVEDMVAGLLQLVPTAGDYGDRFVEAEALIITTAEQLRAMARDKKAGEDMAAEQAEKQRQLEVERAKQEREAAIAKRITDIKSKVFDGAECQTSAEIEKLIAGLNDCQITEELFGAAVSQAIAARNVALASLQSQLETLRKMEAVSKPETQAQEPTTSTPEQTQPESKAETTQTPEHQPEPLPEPERGPDAQAFMMAKVTSFLKTRDFGANENRIRAVLVEFVKFCNNDTPPF